MRFIINFFLFGFLFYLISVFFPEAFQTLVSWAAHVYTFLSDMIHNISDKLGGKGAASPEAPPPTPSPHAMALLFKAWLS